MKVLIVGSGAQGKAIATYLDGVESVEKIKLSDKELERCEEHVRRLESDKVSAHQVDASNIDEVASLAEDVDVIVNALPTVFNLNILDAALKSDSNYQDLAFAIDYDMEKDNFERELEKDEEFKDSNLTALTGTGSSPGVVNVLAARAFDRMDTVRDITILLAENRESEELYTTWWPEGFLYDCLQEPKIFKDGEFEKVQPFSGKKEYTFPKPLGRQTVWNHCHEETMMFPRTIGKEKGLKNVNVKMNGLEFLEALYDYGLFTEDYLEFADCEVRGIDIVLKLFPPTITPDELERKIEEGIIGESSMIMAVEIKGTEDGEKVNHTLFCTVPDIREVNKEWPGVSDENFITGFSAAMMTELLGTSEVKRKGVVTPEQLDSKVRKKFLSKLTSLSPSIEITERIEKSVSGTEKNKIS